LYPDMSTAAPGRAVAGWYEPASAFSFSPAANVTSTREPRHAVWTDALSFDTPSFGTSSFDTPSFDTPSFDTPSFDTPSFDTSSFGNLSYITSHDSRFFDYIMMSPFGTPQLGPAPDAGHQHRFPEPPVGDWPPLPGSSSLDRSVRPIHPQAVTVPALAQSGGNLGKSQQAPEPNVSVSSMAPVAALTSPNDSEAAYVICKWDDCRALVDATKDAVKAHLKEAHHADFSAHSRGKDHGAKGGCKWEGCTRRPMNNLWRHVFEIHARVATKVQCQKCPLKFTRVESLRRHLHNRACRTGVIDPNTRIYDDQCTGAGPS